MSTYHVWDGTGTSDSVIYEASPRAAAKEFADCMMACDYWYECDAVIGSGEDILVEDENGNLHRFRGVWTVSGVALV